MADVNYLNPESLNPFRTGGTSNPTDGGAGSPQSFMEAMALPQKQQDYQNALGLSMQSSQLANQKQGAELQSYLADSGNRQLSRDLLQRQLTTQNTLQPFQAQIEGQNLLGDVDAGKNQNLLKVQKAINALPAENRQAHLQELETASTLLRGMPKDADPNLALQVLKQAGVDVSHFTGQNPSDVKNKLDFLRGMDPESYKYLNQMNIERMKMETEERIHAANNATSRYVADKMSQYRMQMIQNSPTARNNQMDNRAEEIMQKPVNKWTADDHSFMAVWKTRTQEVYNKAGAAATGAADKIKQSIDALHHVGETPSPPVNNPQMPQSAFTPGGKGFIENPTEDQYNNLKDGEKYRYNGQEYTKGSR